MPVRRSGHAVDPRVPGLNYPRRQQYRRLSRAAATAIASAAAVMLALTAARRRRVSRGSPAGARARVQPLRSPLAVARRTQPRGRPLGGRGPACACAPSAEGWRLRHSLPWQGRGDIDSLAIIPTGLGFAIETKTRAYDDRHVAWVRDQAAWLSRRPRRWCRRGAVPVVCVVRARGVQRLEQIVLVVSIVAAAPPNARIEFPESRARRGSSP